MSVIDELKFRRPRFSSDYPYGGGDITYRPMVFDNFFSNIPGEYLIWGGYRYRKFFIRNEELETLYSVATFISVDSQGNDSLSIRAGTSNDTIKNVMNYTGWHKIGVLNSEIKGYYNRPLEVKTRTFTILVPGTDSTGFYKGSRIYISNGRLYDIQIIKDIVWLDIDKAQITITRDCFYSYLSGSSISSICELGDIENNENISLWVRQYIPQDFQAYRNSRPIIGLLGV